MQAVSRQARVALPTQAWDLRRAPSSHDFLTPDNREGTPVSAPMLECRSVTKRFGGLVAVDALDLVIRISLTLFPPSLNRRIVTFLGITVLLPDFEIHQT